jgi:polyvinyl alcohol dehydrogenase (cytochrome)
MRRVAVLGAAVVALALPLAVHVSAAPGCSSTWTMYGRDLAHTFQQTCTSISTANVSLLRPRWVLPTPDSVSASPAVADGVLYDGDWSGNFYAVRTGDGTVLWSRVLNDGETVSFGRITASPALATLAGRQVLLAASGATLYALDPATGALLASQSLDPRADHSPGPVVEIESSPEVAPNGTIYVGLDFNETAGVGAAGLVALSFTGTAFDALWKFDPETNRVYTGPGALTAEAGTPYGCGDVWTSPAIDPAAGAVYFGTSNCANSAAAKAAGELWSEAMFAVDASTGEPLWRFQPAAAGFDDANADDDFGSSPNLFAAPGTGRLVGEGQKSAIYFARNRATGAGRWDTLAGQPGNVSAGNAIGGFIGSTAVETGVSGMAQRIVGATAFPFPDPSDPSSADRATWAVRSLDPRSGAVQWVDRLAAPAYGPTSIAGGVAFVPDTFSDTLLGLDAGTGTTLWAFPLNGPPSSTPVIVGDSVYVGAGTGEQGPNGQNVLAGASGIWAFTPLGA